MRRDREHQLRDERAKILWSQGLTTTQIGLRLGMSTRQLTRALGPRELRTGIPEGTCPGGGGIRRTKTHIEELAER